MHLPSGSYIARSLGHFEYYTAIWNPTKRRDIKALEKVQRRATKLVPEVKDLNYESRLANIGIQSLEDRRSRGDLIQFFKIYKKTTSVNLHSLSFTSHNTLELAQPRVLGDLVITSTNKYVQIAGEINFLLIE